MLKDYFKRSVKHLLEMLDSWVGWLLMALSQVLAVAHVKAGIIALGVVFVFDFITGVAASYSIWREVKAQQSVYFLESRKMRNSLLKACTYLLFICMSWLVWYLFINGTVQLPMSDISVNIIEISIGICIAIECWSILENMKRLGFDLLAKISRVFKGFWKLFKIIKTGE